MDEKITQESSRLVSMNLKIEPEIKALIVECAKAENQSVTAWMRMIAKEKHAALKRKQAKRREE